MNYITVLRFFIFTYTSFTKWGKILIIIIHKLVWRLLYIANNRLIVEYYREITSLLCKALESHGYNTKSSFTGIQGLDILKNELFDMLLLDIMLPYKSGDKLLQELRSFSNIPVLVISAKETTQIKVDLFQLGADDYITKPFDIDEVIARVDANMRRNQINSTIPNKILKYKDIELNISTKQVFVDNNEIILTEK